MTARALLAEVEGRAGCRSLTTARSTGALVGVYQAQEAQIEDDPATPWVTVCETHDNCVCHYTLADARAFAASPEVWCQDCQAIDTLSPEAKASEAFSDDPKGVVALSKEGFRPIEAREIKPGMEIAFREFFLHDEGPLVNCSGEVRSTLVGDVVERDEWELLVSTFDRGNVEVDKDTEVWVR